jgi:asparagine synthase (glutamine-hydrolysing)
MSVIYGKISFNSVLTEEEFALMQYKLNHWYADDSGLWTDQNAGLGHLMLYNTPESLHEKLPLENNQLVITADARIDNRKEIFLLLGIKVDTSPDSTLILKLYKKYNDAPRLWCKIYRAVRNGIPSH